MKIIDNHVQSKKVTSKCTISLGQVTINDVERQEYVYIYMVIVTNYIMISSEKSNNIL